MFAGLALGLPLLLSLVLVAVATALAVHHRAPAAELTAPVAGARRRGDAWSALAAATALGTAAACVAGARWAHDERLVAVFPLAAAAIHAAVALTAEATWPRPTARVRGARLLVRSVRDGVPAGLLGGALAAGLLLAAVCALGSALGAPDGRSVEWRSPDGAAVWSAATFPGAALAAPVAAAGLAVAVLTAAVLQRVPARPAVPGADEGTDAALRRVAAHRVLRTSTAAAVLTLAGLLFAAGVSGQLGGTYQVAEGAWRTSEPALGWRVAADAALWTGPLLVPVALAVLFRPARGLRRHRARAGAA